MPIPAVTASTSLDLGSLLTNLGVLILAIAAAVSGVFTGWQKFKRTLTDEKPATNPATEQYRILSASIMETTSMKALTESNVEMAEQMRKLCARLEEAIDEMRESRVTTRSFNEEAHRLRVSINDAYELLRRFKL